MLVTRIIIAEDDRRILADLIDGLDEEERIEIVGVAYNGLEATAQAERYRPHVVLMDLEMPVMGGIEATRIIREQCPATEILVWTVMEDSGSLLRAYEAGAKGYLMKNASNAEIISRIEATACGDATIPPAMATALRDEFECSQRRQSALRHIYGALTQREVEVLLHLAKGEKNREIAEFLFVTEEAIKKHVRNIVGKLHVTSRTEAACLAHKSGLL